MRKPVLIVISVLFVFATLFAHFKISGNYTYTGRLALLDRGFDFLATAALALLTFCSGRRLSRIFKLTFTGAAEEICFSVMLGTGTLGMLILALGLAGLLAPVPVVILLIVILWLSATELASLRHCINRVLQRALSFTGWMKYLLILFLLLILIAVIEATAPPWTHDELIYHLPATRAFVTQGQVYPLYDNSLGNMPFLIHMIYALCLMAKADIAARLFSLFLTLITALSVYAFAARFLDRTIGFFAMIALLAGAMVVEVGVSARVDVSLAAMLFLTTYSLIVYLVQRERGWLYVTGLLAGFSIGIKLTALAWLSLLAVVFIFERFIRDSKNRKATIRDAALVIFIAAITGSPWFIKNFVWFNNPVYPFRTGEIAGFDSGTVRYLSATDEQQMDAHLESVRTATPERVKLLERTLIADAALRPVRHPLWPWEYYIRPARYFLGDYRHYANFAFLLVPFYLLLPKQKWLSWLLALSVAFYVLIASTTWISRFLLPLYPPLALIAAYTLDGITQRLSAITRSARALPLYVLAACIGVPLAVSIDTISIMKTVSYITGNRSRSEFLSGLDYIPAIQYLNDNLPANSRVMLLGLQMGYHIRHDYLSDESWDSMEWQRVLARNASMSDINSDLKRQGITHILFSPSLFRFVERTGRQGSGGVAYMSEDRQQSAAGGSTYDYTILRNWATFDYYKEHFLEPVYKDQQGHTIYRVK